MATRFRSSLSAQPEEFAHPVPITRYEFPEQPGAAAPSRRKSMNASRGWLVFAIVLFLGLAGCTSKQNPSYTVKSRPPTDDYSNSSMSSTMAVVTPAIGDLGWGDIRGRVNDTIDGSPIAGVTVTCNHRSNHPVSLCSGSVKTENDGSFVFPHVFFQTTDQIDVSASDPNYAGSHFRQEFFTRPRLYINFSLPLINQNPQPCCTAPACKENEVYFCPGVCPCGCGTTCATKTPTPIGFPTKTPAITLTPY